MQESDELSEQRIMYRKANLNNDSKMGIMKKGYFFDEEADNM